VSNRDGNCHFAIGPTVETSMYIVTIIIDHLHHKSDDYIRGLIAHEFAEMSYMFRTVQSEKKNLLRMKPKARQIHMNQLTRSNFSPGSMEYEVREYYVNEEAARLGFSKEVQAGT